MRKTIVLNNIDHGTIEKNIYIIFRMYVYVYSIGKKL